MTPEQCRSARAWLVWSQDDLAKAAKVGLSTVKDFESGKRTPIPATQTAMQAVLERAGIGFSFAHDGDGKAYACGITYSKPKEGVEHFTDSVEIRYKIKVEAVGFEPTGVLAGQPATRPSAPIKSDCPRRQSPCSQHGECPLERNQTLLRTMCHMVHVSFPVFLG